MSHPFPFRSSDLPPRDRGSGGVSLGSTDISTQVTGILGKAQLSVLSQIILHLMERHIDRSHHYDEEDYLTHLSTMLTRYLPLEISRHIVQKKDSTWYVRSAHDEQETSSLSPEILDVLWEKGEFSRRGIFHEYDRHIYHIEQVLREGYHITELRPKERGGDMTEFQEAYALIKEYKIFRHISNQLQRLRSSYTDRLTGVKSRKYLENMIADYFPYTDDQDQEREAKKGMKQYNIIFLDVTAFKRYNDSYGYETGDDMLRELGGLLNTMTRTRRDKVCRFGGDEFVIFQEVGKEQDPENIGNLLRGRISAKDALKNISQNVWERYQKRYPSLPEYLRKKYPDPTGKEYPDDFLLSLDIGLAPYEEGALYQTLKDRAVASMKKGKENSGDQGTFTRTLHNFDETLRSAMEILLLEEHETTPEQRKTALDFMSAFFGRATQVMESIPEKYRQAVYEKISTQE